MLRNEPIRALQRLEGHPFGQEQGGVGVRVPQHRHLGQDIWVTEHRPPRCPAARPSRTRDGS